MRTTSIWAMLMFILAIGCGVMACTNDNGEASLPPHPTETTTPKLKRDVVITIGNLTDITGVSANAQAMLNIALDDIIAYYNEKKLIPGVKLDVITYDGQLDPSKDIPGYEYLKSKGADLIFTGVPDTPLTLKSVVDKDQMVLFSATGYKEMIDPPGYVFVMGTIPDHQIYTLLNWIAENDWDYKNNGPAKIGGASWTDGFSVDVFDAMKLYSEAHPDQFDYAGGHLTNFSFVWDPEIEALRDCDYVFPCVMPTAFMRDFRSAGHTAKFIGTDVHTAFFMQIDEADLWDEIDEMLFVRGGSRWWNDDGPLTDLAKEILYSHRSGEAKEIMRAGAGYFAAATCFYPIFDIIAKAVETVGPENFDSKALYNATQSFSMVLDGIERLNFTETKRYANNYYEISKAVAAERNIVRISDWIPHLTEP